MDINIFIIIIRLGAKKIDFWGAKSRLYSRIFDLKVDEMLI